MTDVTCGILNLRPTFLQRFATPRYFMLVYGLLGTTQAMSFIYFVVSLTTMERRFKIPSKTTGIMLSGNEISQILLSLFLSYYGGQRNKPKWIAWGVLTCSLSCFILALPHFLFGAGEDALALTKEYADMFTSNMSNVPFNQKNVMCSTTKPTETCEDVNYFGEFSLLPVVLVFISQFVLGIGNTLYYSLGNTYMDDNTEKTRTPLLLGIAGAMRTLGPAIGFVLGPLCLSIYIDPSLTPIIDKNDARWMGAWWLGWIILGFLMLLFSVLMSLFPKHLPKIKKKPKESDLPQYPKFTSIIGKDKLNDEIPLENGSSNTLYLSRESVIENKLTTDNDVVLHGEEKPDVDKFSHAFTRIIKNKILMTNVVANTIYILGASVYITYMTKYMEIVYNRSAINSTIIAGPAVLIGILLGFLVSGWIISTKRPRARILLLWNIFVGIIYVSGEISFIFFGCPNNAIEMQLSQNSKANLTMSCNSNCSCDGVHYSPVCHKPTGQIYFSPCHAGCKDQLLHEQIYTNCSCIEQNPEISFIDKFNMEESRGPSYDSSEDWNVLHTGTCTVNCTFEFYMFICVAMTINILGSSSKIANMIINYRCVEKRDKAFAQGMFLLVVSLCALIPGPILYGAIIDSACIEWGEKCGKRTNCLMYDKNKFRFYINSTAFSITTTAVILDVLIWYLVRDLDLYGEDDEKKAATKESENSGNSQTVKNSVRL